MFVAYRLSMALVGGVLAEDSAKIQSDPIKWIDQDAQVVEDLESLEEATGFSTTLGVLVEANNRQTGAAILDESLGAHLFNIIFVDTFESEHLILGYREHLLFSIVEENDGLGCGIGGLHGQLLLCPLSVNI